MSFNVAGLIRIQNIPALLGKQGLLKFWVGRRCGFAEGVLDTKAEAHRNPTRKNHVKLVAAGIKPRCMTSLTVKACRLAENLVSDDAGDGHLMATADATQVDNVAKWTAQRRHARTNQLLADNHEMVFRYAFRLTGCHSSAEDITQEVFLRAFKWIEQLRDPLAERGWLLAITRNEFARWCRLAAAHRATSTDEDVADQVESGEGDLERRDWVQAALEQLPPEFRSVVLMYYFEQLSYTEIAESLVLPIGTVMSRLSRAKSHLKRCLDDIALPQ